jgi:DNA-nicking Smr family endonuclease
MTEEDKIVWNEFVQNMNKYAPTVSYFPPVKRAYRLDLHGMTVDSAHKTTIDFIEKSKVSGLKHITIVTGLSGNIKKEFPYWLERNPHIAKIEQKSGGGAYKLYLKKNQANSSRR